MSSNTSMHSLAAGAIETVVAAGCLILSSTFVITLAFPQPGYARTAAYSSTASNLKGDLAKPSFGAGRKILVLDRAKFDPNRTT